MAKKKKSKVRSRREKRDLSAFHREVRSSFVGFSKSYTREITQAGAEIAAMVEVAGGDEESIEDMAEGFAVRYIQTMDEALAVLGSALDYADLEESLHNFVNDIGVDLLGGRKMGSMDDLFLAMGRAQVAHDANEEALNVYRYSN